MSSRLRRCWSISVHVLMLVFVVPTYHADSLTRSTTLPPSAYSPMISLRTTLSSAKQAVTNPIYSLDSDESDESQLSDNTVPMSSTTVTIMTAIICILLALCICCIFVFWYRHETLYKQLIQTRLAQPLLLPAMHLPQKSAETVESRSHHRTVTVHSENLPLTMQPRINGRVTRMNDTMNDGVNSQRTHSKDVVHLDYGVIGNEIDDEQNEEDEDEGDFEETADFVCVAEMDGSMNAVDSARSEKLIALDGDLDTGDFIS